MKITLTSENYQVTLDSFGAELKSFRDPSGKEFIWNSDPAFWMRSSPLLFPTVGNVRNNKTIINGTVYTMPKHGFCKESDFAVLSQSETQVTFSLTDSEDTLKMYPFHFELRLNYALSGNKLLMTYDVFNKDTSDMYYHIGAHPGFMCPLEEGEVLSDYVLEFSKEERLVSPVYDLENLCFSKNKTNTFAEKGKVLPLNASMFDQDAIYFPHIASRSVSLKNPSTGKGISMDYPGFKSIAFWTPIGGKAPFLCLEPWNCASIFDDEDDIFAHKRDIEVLAPSKNASYKLEISLLGY